MSEPGLLSRVLHRSTSLANILGERRRPRESTIGETDAAPLKLSSHNKSPDTCPQQQHLRKRTSFRERFWSKASANSFASTEQASTRHAAPSRRSSAYVPTHAAADFSRTAKRSSLRLSRLGVTVEEDTTLSTTTAKHSVSVVEDNTRRSVSTADSSANDDEEHLLRTPRKPPSHHLSPMHSSPAPSTASNSTSSSAAPSASDYSLFLAQAKAGDRARRARAWHEIERYSSSQRDSAYWSGESGGNGPSRGAKGAKGQALRHGDGNGTAPRVGSGQAARNGNGGQPLRRQPSVIGQRIAEYIKPSRGRMLTVDERS